MRPNFKKFKRRSIRLRGHDYSSAGIYFITICTVNRECILGTIENDSIHLNDYGMVVQSEWHRSFLIRRELKSDTFIVMPNHIHAIVFINQTVGANGGLPFINHVQKRDDNTGKIRANCHSPLHMKPKSLSSFVAGYKSSVSRKIGFPVWQRNFYDHIIRNNHELKEVRKYITNNPLNWDIDEDNPDNFIVI